MAKILAVAFWPSTKHGRVKSVQVASAVAVAVAAVEDSVVVVAAADVVVTVVVADEVAMVVVAAAAAQEAAGKNGSVMTVVRVDMKAVVAAKNAGDLPHVDFEAEPGLQVPLFIFYRSAHS